MPLCKVNGCRFNDTHLTRHHICGTCHEQSHGQIECGDQKMIDNLAQYYNDTIPDELKCKFIGCNNHDNHTLQGHQCFVCGRFGHPEYACNLGQNLMHITKPCSICKTEIKQSEVKKLFGFTVDCPVCLDKTNDAVSFSCGHGMCETCCEHFFNNYSMDNIYVLPIQYNNMANIIQNNQDDMIEQMNKINSTSAVHLIYPIGMGNMCFLRRKTLTSPIECFYMDAESWGQYGPTTDDRPKLAQFLFNYPANIN